MGGIICRDYGYVAGGQQRQRQEATAVATSTGRVMMGNPALDPNTNWLYTHCAFMTACQQDVYQKEYAQAPVVYQPKPCPNGTPGAVYGSYGTGTSFTGLNAMNGVPETITIVQFQYPSLIRFQNINAQGQPIFIDWKFSLNQDRTTKLELSMTGPSMGLFTEHLQKMVNRIKMFVDLNLHAVIARSPMVDQSTGKMIPEVVIPEGICQKCGSPKDGTNEFCSKDGGRFGPDKPACVKCGAVQEGAIQFCGKCGGEFRAGPPIPDFVSVNNAEQNMAQMNQKIQLAQQQAIAKNLRRQIRHDNWHDSR